MARRPVARRRAESVTAAAARAFAADALEPRRLLAVTPVEPATGQEFLVNSTVGGTQTTGALGSVGVSRAVASDADGDFVAVWSADGQDGSGYGVYARRFDAAGKPKAGEFRVNVFTAGNQFYPSVAMDADGDFVVSWTSFGQDGSGEGVFARRYSADGVAQGGDVQVNTFTAGNQNNPSVAMDADGDFVVAWESYNQVPDAYGIYARRFNAAGVAQGGEIAVGVSGSLSTPSVAMDVDGDFAVAWAGQDVRVRRFSAAGVPQGADVPVNTTTAGLQVRPSVGMDGDGDFVVAWQSDGQDGEGFGVYARRFNAAGAAQGGEIAVNNTVTAGNQTLPSVAMDGDGNFSIAWQSKNLFQDIPASSTDLRQFAATGAALGDQTRVNTTVIGEQAFPSVASDSRGNLVVLFSGNGPGDNPGVFARQYRLPGPLPRGGEVIVNTTTAGNQVSPSAAMDADGDFVVAWSSFGQDAANGYGVYARRFNAAGVPQGNEFPVNTTTANWQFVPSVAMDADGDFVVAWASREQDGSLSGIFARRFNAAGAPQGGELAVNTTTANNQFAPSVAMDADGDFVVVWQSSSQDGSGYGVYARRFSAAGVPQGGEVAVNTFTAGNQLRASVAMDADGDFAVAWESYGQDAANGYGVFARRFSAAGVPQGGEVPVNTTTAGGQLRPSVAMDADGDFAVAWSSNPQDGSFYGVYARRFSAAGVPQGGELAVNTTTANNQFGPSVAMDADGDFVVAWESYGQDLPNSFGVYARRFSTAGVPQSGEVAVNIVGSGDQGDPSAAMDADGDFAVAWTTALQDGSANGISSRRFAGGPPGVASATFASGPHRIVYQFTRDVGGSLSVSDLVLRNDTTAQTLPTSAVQLAYDPATRTATFTATAPSGLPAGNYTATLLADGVTDAANQSLDGNANGRGGDDHVFQFVVTAGDAVAPRVMAVFVDGTAWNTAYRNRLATAGQGEAAFGYRINAAEQTRSLPWTNLNRVSVRFSENVIVAQNDLVVRGVNLAVYPFSGSDTFTYNPATFTATWTLAAAGILHDKLTLDLDADPGTGVTDTAGNRLDGEWTNPVAPALSGDTFPSGDGTAGGDFLFNLKVLPGDINRDGTVSIADINLAKANFGQSAAAQLFGDVTGDDLISIVDLNVAKANFGRTAPA